jgi:hypothetical protein
MQAPTAECLVALSGRCRNATTGVPPSQESPAHHVDAAQRQHDQDAGAKTDRLVPAASRRKGKNDTSVKPLTLGPPVGNYGALAKFLALHLEIGDWDDRESDNASDHHFGSQWKAKPMRPSAAKTLLDLGC